MPRVWVGRAAFFMRCRRSEREVGGREGEKDTERRREKEGERKRRERSEGWRDRKVGERGRERKRA